jgi:hypothetical protein
MSIIPLRLERRFEQRWAARFDFAGNLGPYRRVPDWGLTAQPAAKSQENPPGWVDG